MRMRKQQVMLAGAEREFMRWLWIVFGLICGMGFAIAVAAFAFSGCGRADGCVPEALRCQGTRLEVCDADRNWARVVDCADVTPGVWVCCPDQATCVPAAACGPSAGDADAGDAGDADAIGR
jgi:hypothetical protein